MQRVPFYDVVALHLEFACDATDGVASITLPKGTFKTAIKMKKSNGETAQLEIRDRLYHLKDHLTATQQSPWMDIGLRSLPISKEWHSEDGTAYMLIGPKGGILTAWTSYDDNLPESVLIRRIRRGEKVLQ